MGFLDSLAEGLGSSGLGGAISAGIGALTGSSSAHYQRENFRANTNYANKLAIENAKNKYAYEVEAMQRAGISLATLGGNFQNAGVTGVATGDATAPNMNGTPVDIAGQAQTIAGIKNTQSQTELNKSTSKMNEAETERKQAETRLLNLQSDTFMSRLNAEIDQIVANTKYINTQSDLNSVEKEKAQLDLKFQRESYNDKIDQIKKQNIQLDATIRSLDAHTNMDLEKQPFIIASLKAGIAVAYSQKTLNEASAKEALSNVNLNEELADHWALSNSFDRETLQGRISVLNTQNELNNYEFEPRLQRAKVLVSRLKDLKDVNQKEVDAMVTEAQSLIYQVGAELKKNQAEEFTPLWQRKLAGCIKLNADAINFSCGYNASNFAGSVNSTSNSLNTNVNATPTPVTPKVVGFQ